MGIEKRNRIIAVIPARAGSKGLPQKNIKELNGRPLIAYTIEAAIKSGVFDRIVVSTDGEDIARIAVECGAEVPFLRPNEFAADNSTSIEVINHSLEFLTARGEKYDLVCLLQPTSPLRTEVHIREAYRLYNEKEANSVISVCECDHSPLWTNTIDSDLRIDHFIVPELSGKTRQDLPTYYRLNGAIYIADTEMLRGYNSFFMDKTFAYMMTKNSSIDIDTEEDFLYAEFLIRLKQRTVGGIDNGNV